ncbi:MAG: dTMP kinase [Acidobacteria bacterium]|nr:dTMP kinase [Acidobacteriota bacterium]MBU4405675.1 dTMP kinase [Acidobacteriota bacterium]
MGQLIVFEGIDGSGKTSLSRMFHAYLLENGVPAIWLREPSDSPLGEKIRGLAQDKESISVHEELEYFLEDRRWDVENNILPALRSGKTVVLDRYYYSNACYQGARGLDMEAILALNRQFAPEADLVFIIDVNVDRALARISSSRQGVAKLFEKKDFLEKVRANYLKLAGTNLVRIDGNPDLKTVMADVISHHSEHGLKKVSYADKK